MADPQVYLEKMSAFSRMLRLQGLLASPQETADACRVLIEIGFENRALVQQSLVTVPEVLTHFRKDVRRILMPGIVTAFLVAD